MSLYTLDRSKDLQDIFITQNGAIDIVCRSNTSKATEFVRWLSNKGVHRAMQEHQQTIKYRMQRMCCLTMICNIVTIRYRLYIIKTLDYRMKFMQKISRQKMWKYHTLNIHTKLSLCKGVQLQQRGEWVRKKFWGSEEIMVIDNPSNVQAFNRFEKESQMERYEYNFKLSII